MKPHLYPCLCYSYFHRREQNQGGCQQLPLIHGTVFLLFMCGQAKLKTETCLVSTKCHYGYPFDIPKVPPSLLSPPWLDGWQ